jgi:hypothetical protein
MAPNMTWSVRGPQNPSKTRPHDDGNEPETELTNSGARYGVGDSRLRDFRPNRFSECQDEMH